MSDMNLHMDSSYERNKQTAWEDVRYIWILLPRQPWQAQGDAVYQKNEQGKKPCDSTVAGGKRHVSYG